MALTAPVSVTITCPVCDQTEVATGTGGLSSTWDPVAGLRTFLSYDASVEHDCPGIAAPTP